jgi:hypothetical protein
VIDPTDARLNLQEAISKFVNKKKTMKKPVIDTFSSICEDEDEIKDSDGKTNTHSNS